jgi:hypothetical protein
MPAIIPAAAAIGSAVIGAGSSAASSGKASSSAKAAAALQQQQYQTTRGDLSPYFTPGIRAYGNALTLAESGPNGPNGQDYIGQAGANVPLTQAELEQTPGYQFTLAQGLKSTQSAAAARGLGVSGAALKGAAEYATGLANKTYLDQFNVAQQRFGDYLNLNTGQQGNVQNQFSRLNSLAAIGENAAAQSGTAGTSAAATAGNYLNQAGLASAAGGQGVASAITGAANNYLALDAYNRRTAANPTSGYGNGVDASQVASRPAP